jgi:hypothetical protein
MGSKTRTDNCALIPTITKSGHQLRRFWYLQIRLRRRMTCTATTRRLASVSGITSSCGISCSGRRGIVVQTGTVHRICNSHCSNTADSNSSIVVPDQKYIGPTGDIDSPIEASACSTGSGKRTLRDGEGSAARDGTVKADSSTWRYSTCQRRDE